MHGSTLASARPKSIVNALIGEIVGYIKRKQQIERESLSARRWHIVRVWTGAEAKVARKIEQEFNFGTYIPLEPVLPNNKRGNWQPKMRRIYPGYVFVGFDPRGVLWSKIEEIDRVIEVIKINEHPVQIGDVEMARVRDVEGLRLNHRNVAPMAVAVGVVVRVVEFMPYTGLFSTTAVVDEEGRRVLVNLCIMGHEVPLWLTEGRFEVV